MKGTCNVKNSIISLRMNPSNYQAGPLPNLKINQNRKVLDKLANFC